MINIKQIQQMDINNNSDIWEMDINGHRFEMETVTPVGMSFKIKDTRTGGEITRFNTKQTNKLFAVEMFIKSVRKYLKTIR